MANMQSGPLSLRIEAAKMLGPGSLMALNCERELRLEQQRANPFEDYRAGKITNSPCFATMRVMPVKQQRQARVKKVLVLSPSARCERERPRFLERARERQRVYSRGSLVKRLSLGESIHPIYPRCGDFWSRFVWLDLTV